MNNYISFRSQDGRLPGYIRFALSPKGFDAIAQATGGNAMAVLQRLSASKVLLAVPEKNTEWVRIHNDDGVFACSQNKDCLLINRFYRNTLKDQNNALKLGVCLEVTAGVIIQIRLTGKGYYFDIVNGRRDDDKKMEAVSVAPALQCIRKAVTEAAKQQGRPQQEEAQEEEYQPEKRLAELLHVAESYSILSSELEERNAAQLGRILYSGVSSVVYDRKDRVVYQFGVSDLDENVFKVGVQVEIEDKNQERHNAEILELVKADADAPAAAIKLLFNEHIGIDIFQSSGFFSLSFSTVNKDVQLAANEKIASGEAKAKYMDAVLGRSAPGGFEKKDLSWVHAELAREEYPPNASQTKAICAGINTRDVFLVMGPPGTGKTTVIAQWVKYFVLREHKRVLVSSQNNKAVDNVLARIAEEKNVDMIRIGSESKLQSDVVPFMYENKVAALREAIEENSRGHRDSLEAIVLQWEQYQDQLSHTQSLEAHRDSCRKVFATAAKERVLPGYQMLQRQRRTFGELDMQITRTVKKIITLNRRLERHVNARNFLIRFFTGLGHKSRLKKIRQQALALDQLRRTEQAQIRTYSATYAQYQKDVEILRSTQFAAYWEARGNFKEALHSVQTKPARPETDIWDMFRESRDCAVRTTADFAGQKAKIAADIQKARALQGVLSTWQEDMGGRQNYALGQIVLETVDLVGATCIGINSQKRFASLDFDVTIIDEAGQIQIHNALVPMSVSNKVIMLGDHMQIPPTADQELVELCEENGVRTDLLGMSLFERMYRDLPESNKIMLDQQYRMPGEIADTISEWFYDGKYFSPDFKRNQKGLLPKLSPKPYIIIDTSQEKNRRERPVANAGCDNPLEASIIADIIRDLQEDPECNLRKMGVISAYKSQVKCIKNRLNTFLPKEQTAELVATLDSYQGQERDIIFYSFTKSSDTSPLRRRIGFLNELRRLNVAMTRCKKTLVLIGDMEFLGGCRHCEKDEFDEEIYEKSERQFSDFIQKMLKDVRSGRGELLTYREFVKRLKGGDRHG